MSDFGFENLEQLRNATKSEMPTDIVFHVLGSEIKDMQLGLPGMCIACTAFLQETFGANNRGPLCMQRSNSGSKITETVARYFQAGEDTKVCQICAYIGLD